MPFGLQPWHLIVIAVVALIIFGPARLPEIGHGIGKAITEFRKGAREMGESFHEEVTRTSNAPAQPPVQPVQSAYTPSLQYAPPPQYPQAAQQPSQGFDPGPAQTSPSQPVASTGNFCIHCGASNPPGARFCNTCGQQVNAAG